jgi:hypothetical protein
MTEVMNQLANIEVNAEMLRHIDMGSIARNFRENYSRLDELKNFRTDYEKKNALTRWWHNDKLRNAQLDSVEVQAEFSKVIGQLMMIGIFQSKELSSQQTLLNTQQVGLKTQADGIEHHTGELEKQHQILAEQSAKLEKLVREYFELKGLTEEGAKKLIAIATEVKNTKEEMLITFSVKTGKVEELVALLSTSIDKRLADITDQVTLLANQNRNAIDAALSSSKADKLALEASLNEKIDCIDSDVGGLGRDLENLSNRLLERDTAFTNDVAVLNGGLKIAVENHVVLNVELANLLRSLQVEQATNQGKFDAINSRQNSHGAELSTVLLSQNMQKEQSITFMQEQHANWAEIYQFKQDTLASFQRAKKLAIGGAILILIASACFVYLLLRI